MENLEWKNSVSMYLETELNSRKKMSEERFNKFEERLVVKITANLKKRETLMNKMIRAPGMGGVPFPQRL